MIEYTVWHGGRCVVLRQVIGRDHRTIVRRLTIPGTHASTRNAYLAEDLARPTSYDI